MRLWSVFRQQALVRGGVETNEHCGTVGGPTNEAQMDALESFDLFIRSGRTGSFRSQDGRRATARMASVLLTPADLDDEVG